MMKPLLKLALMLAWSVVFCLGFFKLGFPFLPLVCGVGGFTSGVSILSRSETDVVAPRNSPFQRTRYITITGDDAIQIGQVYFVWGLCHLVIAFVAWFMLVDLALTVFLFFVCLLGHNLAMHENLRDHPEFQRQKRKSKNKPKHENSV